MLANKLEEIKVVEYLNIFKDMTEKKILESYLDVLNLTFLIFRPDLLKFA